MYKLRNLDIRGSEKINAELMKFIEKLKKKINVKAIYLHGSYARGDFNEGSDIDLVIVGNFEEKFKDRIIKIIGMTDLPIEPLCYTENEFNKMIDNRNPFILAVIEHNRNLIDEWLCVK